MSGPFPIAFFACFANHAQTGHGQAARSSAGASASSPSLQVVMDISRAFVAQYPKWNFGNSIRCDYQAIGFGPTIDNSFVFFSVGVMSSARSEPSRY
jgi:hypothetical protein